MVRLQGGVRRSSLAGIIKNEKIAPIVWLAVFCIGLWAFKVDSVTSQLLFVSLETANLGLTAKMIPKIDPITLPLQISIPVKSSKIRRDRTKSRLTVIRLLKSRHHVLAVEWCASKLLPQQSHQLLHEGHRGDVIPRT